MLMIDDPELERFIREEAARTGLTPNEVLREYLLDLPSTGDDDDVPVEEQMRRDAALREIQESVKRLPILDPRPMDELLGYDDAGLPT